MIRACYWDQLKDESGQNVEHWSETGVNKRNDGSATAKCLFLFCQDVSGGELTTIANGPWVCFPMFLLKGSHKRSDQGRRIRGHRFENGRILECLFNGLIIQTGTVNTEGRRVLVFAVENGAFKG